MGGFPREAAHFFEQLLHSSGFGEWVPLHLIACKALFYRKGFKSDFIHYAKEVSHLIEFKHVSKTYPNGVKGLKDVNLTFEQGEFVAIIGLSGAGKSTLIRTINRMIDITEGELTVDGTDVMKLSGKSLRRFRRKIGMIFQSFNLVTRSTAIKNVLTSMVPDMSFLRVLLGLFTKEQKLAALAALDKVGILDKAYIR